MSSEALRMNGDGGRVEIPRPAPTPRLLMDEIHHRISNSLQLVSSMLQLQANRSDNPEIRQALTEAAGRIVAVASVHRRLHEADGADQIDAGEFLGVLVGMLRNAILDRAKGHDIALEIPTPLMLSNNDLGRIGLIVNELVTNALKYGDGRILIRIRRFAETLEIVAEDEGRGFPPKFVPNDSGGFGMRLIAALAMCGPASVAVDRSVPFARIAVKVAAKIDSAPP
jgi:two-component sensor histidine kinase